MRYPDGLLRAGHGLIRLADLVPAAVGVEGGHARRDLSGAGAEIFLVDPALVVHQERHHAGVPVFGGPGDQGEAADHLAARDIVDGAAGRARSLAGEDLVVIAVIRDPLLAGTIALGRRGGGARAERALPLAGF